MREAAIFFLLGVLVLVLLWHRIFRSRRTTARHRASDRGDPGLASVRRDLLTKMGHDVAAVDRIVNGLRRKHPGEPLTSIYERAICEWLSDNNRG
jgi:hypothetical protein